MYFVRLRTRASQGRSRFLLRFCNLFDIGLDETNTLCGGFSGRRVCEGNFLDHPEVDQLVQPRAEETTLRFGRVLESLLFYEYGAKRRSSRNSPVL